MDLSKKRSHRPPHSLTFGGFEKLASQENHKSVLQTMAKNLDMQGCPPGQGWCKYCRTFKSEEDFKYFDMKTGNPTGGCLDCREKIKIKRNKNRNGRPDRDDQDDDKLEEFLRSGCQCPGPWPEHKCAGNFANWFKSYKDGEITKAAFCCMFDFVDIDANTTKLMCANCHNMKIERYGYYFRPTT